jgi:hypothetical protein
MSEAQGFIVIGILWYILAEIDNNGVTSSIALGLGILAHIVATMLVIQGFIV